MRYVALLLLAVAGGCGRQDGASQKAEAETWTQLHSWGSRSEGSVLTDVDVPSERWRLLIRNTGDDYVMVAAADASGRDVAVGTATEKDVDTIQVIGSKGVHKIAIAKMGRDGEYRVVLEVAPE